MSTKLGRPAGEEHQQAEPDEQQEVPVGGAELEPEPELLRPRRRPRRRGAARASATRPPRMCRPCSAGQQVEEAVGRVAGQRGSRWRRARARRRAGRRGRPSVATAPVARLSRSVSRVALAVGGERALQRDAREHQHAGVQPDDPRHRHRPPVGELHAHEVGAGEEREERADHREEDAERDLLGRHARRRRARRPGRAPTSSQGLDISPLAARATSPRSRSPPARKTRMTLMRGCRAGRCGQGSSWAMKSCGAPGTL